MSVDQRLFSYALEPQLLRLRWRLDEAFTVVARLVEERATLQDQCGALDAQAAAAVQETSRQQAVRIDPVRARHGLEFLASLHRRKMAADADLQRNLNALDDAREALAQVQREIEKLEADRRDLLADHGREQDRRQLREADQDWIARDAWRAGVEATMADRP